MWYGDNMVWSVMWYGDNVHEGWLMYCSMKIETVVWRMSGS